MKDKPPKFGMSSKGGMHLELINWIGGGPSLRSRARLALFSAFLISAPALFLGVMRVDEVEKTTRHINELSLFEQKVTEAKLAVSECRMALWRFLAQSEFENERSLIDSTEKVRRLVSEMLLEVPPQFDMATNTLMGNSALRIQMGIDQTIKSFDDHSGNHKEAAAVAELSLTALANELGNVHQRASDILEASKSSALTALGQVGRDELILFLILIIGIPFMIGLVPIWIVAPLVRLRRIEHKIEEGRIRDLAVSGQDEISALARTIKSALVWREELDLRKSAKIFEIRNVLRAVINHVCEPVLITDRQGKINYANQPASELFGIESHYLEGTNVADHIASKVLIKALTKAVQGDVPELGVAVDLEFKDGRSVLRTAQLSAVRDRDGQVSRLVVVLLDPNAPAIPV